MRRRAWDWLRAAWDCQYCGRRRRHAGADPVDGHELPIALKRWLFALIGRDVLTGDPYWVMSPDWGRVIADLLDVSRPSATIDSMLLMGMPVVIDSAAARPRVVSR